MILKVLIHVNEAERWGVALNSITNMKNGPDGANIETHVISNGHGVNGFVHQRDQALPEEIERMKQLAGRGVRFFACNNALAKEKIESKELPDFVDVVASSMEEIVKRQADGFGYIKP